MNDTDIALAARLAREAGELLLDLRAEQVPSGDARQLGAAGDRRSHEYLVRTLAEQRPGDVVMSEEGADDARRRAADRVWIVDPLDGTNEYGEGRSDWAVHVGLWQRTDTAGSDQPADGGDLVAGAVALPGRSVTLSGDPALRSVTAHPDGLDIGDAADRADPPSTQRPWRIAVSRSRAPAVARQVAEVLPVELVPLGSAGYKIVSVVLGEVDAYLHAGGQYEWDSAAPVAIARAAGLHASRIDGSPLRYNAADPYLPDLLVARPEVASAVLDACCTPGSRPVSAVPRST
ncbi:3'(2'),5'-bisphosphate nucleotidase CysQ [Phytoactinopolyspora halophila]|uniref:3'(2'),5'-bisphosphate nucleotidase CysQ n=1 Tax=Phytoactinopolyspora halophila TaxID=1981511 RepID=UPI001FE2B0F3|nr:3'(2'),5'-bisphosphate nucleotidase CysQ [Phytoactinopolyspora halophila]